MESRTAAALFTIAVLVILATVPFAFPVWDNSDSNLLQPEWTVVSTEYPSPVPIMESSPPVPFPAAAIISESEATARLLEDYNTWDYSIQNVTLTDRYAGKILYEFSMVPGSSGFYHENATFFIDAETSDFYNPSQEYAGMTIGQAKDEIGLHFPEMGDDSIRIAFTNGSKKKPRGWDFRIIRDNTTRVYGLLHADTGDLKEYVRIVPWSERPDTSPITMDAARLRADVEVLNRNGRLPVIMTSAGYSPLLGAAWAKSSREYSFVYNRILQNITCASDGITVTIHPITGNVLSYQKKWVLTEDAIISVSVPAIPSGTASDIVEQQARSQYPLSADSIRVLSVDLRWKDTRTTEGIPLAPGSIPLAWRVKFDDEYLRAQQSPTEGVGWVDALNGSLLELNYRH